MAFGLGLPPLGRPWSPSTAALSVRRRGTALRPRVASISASVLTWIEEQGGSVHPRVALDPQDPAELAIDASAGAVPASTTLLTLPVDSCLAAKDTYLLTLRLLEEQAVASASSYAPLLDFLPAAPSRLLRSPILWTDAQLRASLGASPTLDKVQQLRSRLLASHDSDPAILAATAVVWSRAIEAQPLGAALLPVPVVPEDVGPGPGARWDIVSAGFLGRRREVRIVSAREMGPCERIAVADDVGASATGATGDAAAEFLERGIVSEHYPVELEFGLTAMDPFVDDKEDVLAQFAVRDLDYDPDTRVGRFRVSRRDVVGGADPASSEDGVVARMVQFVRMVCLGAADAFMLEAVFRGEVWGFCAEPVSRDNESLVIDTVLAAVDAARAGDLDRASPDFVEEGGAVCAAEAAALDALQDVFERERAALDAKEYYQERRLRDLDLLRPVDESEIIDSESGARSGRAFDENY